MLEVPCCVKVTHFYLIIIQYQLQNNHLSNFRDLFDNSLYMFNTFQKSSKYYSQVKGYDAALLFNFFFSRISSKLALFADDLWYGTVALKKHVGVCFQFLATPWNALFEYRYCKLVYEKNKEYWGNLVTTLDTNWSSWS